MIITITNDYDNNYNDIDTPAHLFVTRYISSN